MSVFRVKRKSDYSIIPNGIFRDKRLSLKAKGLLAQMLSLPEDWNYTLRGLATINACGIDYIRGGVNELIDAGYIIRTRRRDDHGRQHESIYTVYEEPQQTADPNDKYPEVVVDEPVADDISTKNPEPSKEESPMPDQYRAVRAQVMRQINYQRFLTKDSDKRIYEIVEIMTDVLTTQKKTIRINGEDRPREIVQEHYRQITEDHIDYLFDCLKKVNYEIKNMHAYLLTALYHVTETFVSHVTADVDSWFNAGLI